ncbi:hypothetical protein [Paracnuella aquatica]|uniref:hypothetical protein n=1 Tax=Paracnuella aquatica TaxID=2268757 RepID=UPI000DEEEB15|nr:hypothetical protein [Paracnuella aquatica]RPD50861.1 hypothetical protein DRJ53_05030 [Paracnuella aquatica]
MKKWYTLGLLFTFLLLAGCSKDVLKKYDKRIVGTWRIAAINNYSIGGDRDNLAFSSGNFTFNEDGSLSYVDGAGATYQGNWDIRKKYVDDDFVRAMQLTAVGTTTPEVLTEYYDDIVFLGKDHFRATTVIGFRTYMTHFRR